MIDMDEQDKVAQPSASTVSLTSSGSGGSSIGDSMVVARRVSKRFGTLDVLKDADLCVDKGQVAVVIGPSGSGKSTLLRCIHWLLPADSGEVYIDGQRFGYSYINGKWVKDRQSQTNRKRSHVGMVFQHFNLFSHLTALQNVMLGLRDVKRLSKAEAKRAAIERLAEMDLVDKLNSHPSRLSGGQQQRVAIARALAMDPKVMLFDECTSALDPELVEEVLQVMINLAQEGMTMVVVTHELAFAKDVGDVMHFFYEGKILESAAPKDMLTAPKREATKRFLAKVIRQV
jgi:polar amino acid transport system ATP-binding protein